MNKLLMNILCITLLATTLVAQDKDKDKKASTAGGLPPVIDRELIFGNPEIAGAAAFTRRKIRCVSEPWKDTRNVYVKGVE